MRVGTLNAGTVTGSERELGGYDGNKKRWSVVCIYGCVCKRLNGRGTNEIVGEAASCFVVVQTSKSGMVWG